MKTLACVACLACLICAGVSCGPSPHEPSQDGAVISEPVQDGPNSGDFYFNSFESPEDTLGWEGITAQMLVNDPAPGGGHGALRISGDCIQPTAYIVFPPSGSARSYRLSFWGKMHDSVQRGMLILAIDGDDDPGDKTELTVEGEQWAFYRSEKTLHLSADEALRLEIMVGGIVSASMSIDCIKIEESGRRTPQASPKERGGSKISS